MGSSKNKVDMDNTGARISGKVSRKRKPTPPQTLFPDFRTAHFSILSKPPGNNTQEMLDERREMYEREIKPLVPRNHRLDPLVESQAKNLRSGIVGDPGDDVAGLSLGSEDIPLKSMRTGSSPSPYLAPEHKRVSSWSTYIGNSSRLPVSDDFEEALRNRTGGQTDTISDIISDYRNNTGRPRRSQSIDSLFTTSSASHSADIDFPYPERSADHGESEMVGSAAVESNHEYERSSVPSMTEFTSGFLPSFDICDFSQKELRQCRHAQTRCATSKDHPGTSLPLGTKDEFEMNVSQRHRQSLSVYNNPNCRHLSKDESTDSFLLSSAGLGFDDDVKGGANSSLNMAEFHLVKSCKSLNSTKDSHAKINHDDSKPYCQTAKSNTDQEWETVDEGNQSSEAVRTDDSTVIRIISSLRSDSAGTRLLGKQSISPWSPLRSTKATSNLKSLARKMSDNAECSTQHHLSVIALLPRQGAASTHPVYFYNPTNHFREHSRDRDRFPYESVPKNPKSSPALQSSSLFPHNIVGADTSETKSCQQNLRPYQVAMDNGKALTPKGSSSESESDFIYLNPAWAKRNTRNATAKATPPSNLPKPNKGKERAHGISSSVPDTVQVPAHPHQYPLRGVGKDDIQQLNREWDEIFAFDDVSDTENHRTIAKPLPTLDLDARNSSTSDADAQPKDLAVTTVHRSSSQHFDNTMPAQNPMLSQIAQEYDPDDHDDVSAFLRRTAPVQEPSLKAGPSRPAYIRGEQSGKTLDNLTAVTYKKAKPYPVGSGDRQSDDHERLIAPAIESSKDTIVQERLQHVRFDTDPLHVLYGRPSMDTEGSRRSLGLGVALFSSVSLSNGNKIGAPDRVIINENNLPVPNTCSFTDRLPPLIHRRCGEFAVRHRILIANDDFNRLKHECPQFPLRNEHVAVPHLAKNGKLKYKRLQKMEDGKWLEQAYCTYHQRTEFSTTLGLRGHEVEASMIESQHKAGRKAVLVGSLLFPVGGAVVLWDLYEDCGLAADIMRWASGDERIVHPHGDERRLAHLMFEVLWILWLGVVAGAIAVCVWASTKYFW